MNNIYILKASSLLSIWKKIWY